MKTVAVMVILIILLGIIQVKGKVTSCNVKDTALSRTFIKSGDVKFQQQDFEGAIKDYTKAIEYNSASFLAYGNRGYCKNKLGQFDEAITDFTKAISINGKDWISYSGRGDSKQSTGAFESAIEDYTMAIKVVYPDTISQCFFGRGLCYSRLNKFEEAIRDYNVSIRKNPEFQGAYMNRGRAYLSTEQYEKAIEDFNMYLSFKGSNPVAYYLNGLAYLKLKKADYAIYNFKLFMKVLPPESANRFNYGEVYLSLADSYSLKNDPVNARDNYTKAFEADPDYQNDPLIYAEWAKSEYDWSNFTKSIDLYSKAISKATVENPVKPDYYYYMSLSQVALRDTLAAMQSLKKAIELDESYYPAYTLRVQTYFEKMDFKTQNIADLNKMIGFVKRNEDKAKLHALKSLLELNFHDYTEAKSDADKAIELNPNDPFYYLYRILALNLSTAISYTEEDKIDVQKNLDKAIQLNDSLWQPYLLKAVSFFCFKDQSSACINVKKAHERGLILTEDKITEVCSGKINSKKMPFISKLEIREIKESAWPVNPELLVIEK